MKLTVRQKRTIRSVVRCFAAGVTVLDYGPRNYTAYARDPADTIHIGRPPKNPPKPVDTEEVPCFKRLH